MSEPIETPATGPAAVQRSYLMLVNPSAGGGRAGKRLPEIEDAMSSAGLRYRVVLTSDLNHAEAEAEAGVAAAETPVVVSGDGMIGRIGGFLADRDTALGIIPGGRGNDLARVLGIPTEPAAAVANLAAGNLRRIDVGEANGARFLCIASCGFDSDANRIANEARFVKGPLVYAYAALRALAQWKPARFTLHADDGFHEIVGYSVAAANSQAYGGGMFVAPEAQLDDGLLDVVTTSEVSRLRFIGGLPSVFRGEHLTKPEVGCFRTAELRIEADRPFSVYADGEHLTELPVTIKLRAAALDVIAPGAGD